MNEITIGLSNREKASERFLTAWESGRRQGAYIGFESEEQLPRGHEKHVPTLPGFPDIGKIIFNKKIKVKRHEY